MAARRTVPISARILVMLRAIWIPALWSAVFLPWFALDYGGSAWVVALRDCVDAPAQVVESRVVFESRGKGVRSWQGYRVRARFAQDGAEAVAVGDIDAIPPDGWVRARVPIGRPDLAVAFVDPGPRYTFKPFMSGFAALLGIVGLGLMVQYNRGLLRRLAEGRLARARCSQLRTHRSTVVLDVTYTVVNGTVRVERSVADVEARRVLADPEPMLVHAEDDLGDVFLLGEVDGLRANADGSGISPASWARVAWKAAPLVALLASAAFALAASRLLPP